MKLILGTRGSPLALAQARMVASALEVQHSWPADSVELKIVRTSGDRIQDRPLAEVGGKALWTKELDERLLSGETHASVHSVKDVESMRPAALCIAAMLPRADVRDRLIGAGSISQLKAGAVVGTSSPRRAAQLRALRPDLEIVMLRGNVDTRLAKLAVGECDATLLAAAGLDRLGKHDVGAPVDLLPAPAQGAVGIECRADDDTTRRILQGINDDPTFAAVQAERAFTRALGGDCQSPVAALAVITRTGAVHLRVQLLVPDGAEQVSAERKFKAHDKEGPAAMAKDLLKSAPGSIRELFQPQ